MCFLYRWTNTRPFLIPGKREKQASNSRETGYPGPPGTPTNSYTAPINNSMLSSYHVPNVPWKFSIFSCILVHAPNHPSPPHPPTIPQFLADPPHWPPMTPYIPTINICMPFLNHLPNVYHESSNIYRDAGLSFYVFRANLWHSCALYQKMSLKFFHPLHLNFILPNFRSIPLRNEQTRPHFATSVETCFTRHGCELVYSAHNMRYEMPVSVVTSR